MNQNSRELNISVLKDIQPYGKNPRRYRCVSMLYPCTPHVFTLAEVEAACPGFTELEHLLIDRFETSAILQFMKMLKADKEHYPEERYLIHGPGYLTPWREWVSFKLDKGNGHDGISLVRRSPYNECSFYVSLTEWERNIPGFMEQYKMTETLGCTPEQATSYIKAYFSQHAAIDVTLPDADMCPAMESASP